MPWDQKDRLLTVDTPLGADVLLLTQFKATEGISRPFELELTMLSENHNISFEAIVGEKVTVSVTLSDGSKRYFHGHVSSFSQGRGGGEQAGDPRFSFYRATVVPWFWLLTRTADLRIFQKLSVQEIAEKIFTEKELRDYSFRLDKSYEKREYCVQYRETDFNFISRLLEEEGIYYFFEHESDKHTMVFADTPEKHTPCPGQDTARYRLSAGGWLEEDVITALEKTKQVRVGKCTLSDYDFEKPKTDLKVEVPSKQKLGPGEREFYDYPGRYVQRSGGERLTSLRMEEEEARITTITGSSVCRAFTSGYRFTLADHYRSDVTDKEYVLTEIVHEAKNLQEYTGAEVLGDEEEFSYVNRFSCIPFEIPYRPPRVTTKPVVEGTQTAIVVGPSGEEIYTDEHGRVKVQFHWDREGKRDENSSCWIRVSQLWAGVGWGAMYIPRIGQEVIVDFLEGDPDKPIIIGRVYHGNNKPPYSLPGEKTKSTIKSDSSLGGGGFNEFRFEDKKGSEEIFLHGQKDWTIVIENNKNQSVGHDETTTIGNDRKENVNGNETVEIGKKRTNIVGGDEKIDIAGGRTRSVGRDESIQIGKTRTKVVGAEEKITVHSSRSAAVGKDETLDVAGDRGVSVGKNYALNVGKMLLIEAGNQIVLRSGDASITLKKSGDILVDGKKISIQASGTVNVKASGDIKIKGSKVLTN